MRLRRPLISIALVLGTAAVACGGETSERDQWTVWLTTDAPVPQLVDRGLVEVIDETGALACGDCRRQIGLPTDPSAWPISFGIAAPGPVHPVRVRVRLYRASRAGNDGLPQAAATLDLTAVMPTVSGNTDTGLVLRAECLGVASDPATHKTCAGPERALVDERTLDLGKPDPAVRPGTWPRAMLVPCEGAPEDMACVPGGFLVLGDAKDVRLTNRPVSSHLEERYVTLSPFAIDRDEVNVGAVRGLVNAGRVAAAPTMRDPLSSSPYAVCTYLGATDATNDQLPANCVSFELAAQVCGALGKRLPTEAEWEWAAGNLTEETRFPWGSIGDPCDLADVGLGRGGADLVDPESTACRYLADRPGRAAGIPPVVNPGDVTGLAIRRLAGGVSEWVADYLSSYLSPCWKPQEPFLLDPRCDEAEQGLHGIRGSSWLEAPGLVSSVERQAPAPRSKGYANIGLRCALSRKGDKP